MQIYRIIFIILAVILSTVIGFAVYYGLKYLTVSEERKKVNNRIRRMMYDSVVSINDSNPIKRHAVRVSVMLSKLGANYLLKRTINPYIYMVFCLLLASAGSYVIYDYYGIIGSLAGFSFILFLPRLLLMQSNKHDNEKMLKDIRSMYDSLTVQTSAGVFLTDAIGELSNSVKDERLKKALVELRLATSIKHMSLEEALDEFQMKFRSPEIDMLVMVLNQSLISGQASVYLRDLKDEMADIQNAISKVEQDGIDLKLRLIELLVYVGILAVIFGAMVYELVNTLGDF